MVVGSVISEDIRVALGRAPLDDNERAQWDMWIRDAQIEISAGPDGKQLIDLNTLDQDRLSKVIRDAVVAKVRRPDDATQVDISIDDGRVSKIYQSSTGSIYIRPEWWSLLGLVAPAGAFSIRPGFVPDRPCW